jgi:hypothetical protein
MDAITQETIDNLSSENASLRYEVDKLQRKNDNQSITIGEFQEGLCKFVDAPLGKVAYFTDAEKKLNQLKSENHQLKEERRETAYQAWFNSDKSHKGFVQWYEVYLKRHERSNQTTPSPPPQTN